MARLHLGRARLNFPRLAIVRACAAHTAAITFQSPRADFPFSEDEDYRRAAKGGKILRHTNIVPGLITALLLLNLVADYLPRYLYYNILNSKVPRPRCADICILLGT